LAVPEQDPNLPGLPGLPVDWLEAGWLGLGLGPGPGQGVHWAPVVSQGARWEEVQRWEEREADPPSAAAVRGGVRREVVVVLGALMS
jgi:hypothetical protein